MSYYRTCPGCGVHLDPGEICQDCKEKAATALQRNDGKADRKGDQTNSSEDKYIISSGA